MNQKTATERVRAFGYFIVALVYFYFAQIVAGHAASGFSPGEGSEFVARTMFLFLLLVGYWLMGRAFERQRRPLASMGLDFRPGWGHETGLGAALGWGMLIASILPMALTGGLIVGLWSSPHQLWMLVVDFFVLAIASLAEEVAFRGYPFQRLVDAIGPVMATLVMSGLFGVVHISNPSSNRASLMVTVFTGWLLSAAYLRTRALWFSWGWHFAWNVSTGLIFGLPISGITTFSPVIQSNTIGPPWITGGDYGPEGSLVTALVILAGLFVVFRMTRSYAYKYGQPPIVPGGMPVDLSAMSRVVAPHHATLEPATTPAAERLVQIGSAPAASSRATVSPAEPEADFSLENERPAATGGTPVGDGSGGDPISPGSFDSKDSSDPE
ncbi:MAG TPA: type II CAAX endopeptidase family protein [Acidobacteriaceae bacterium]|nr:type II CAAX endopeptidase family protein [Acidobacteriaceae bacterium]